MPVDPRLAQLDELPEEDTPETPVETPAPAADTPEVTPVVDFENRYNNLRPEFDRTKQQLAEEREARQQYEAELERLRQQPQTPADAEWDDDDLADPVARQHIARLEAQLAAQAEKDAEREYKAAQIQRQQEETTYIDDELDAIEAEFGDELSDEESRMLGNYSLANRDEHGRPDVRLAYQTFTKVFEGRKAKWVDTKPSARPATGGGAVEVPDLDDSEQRADYLDRMFDQE